MKITFDTKNTEEVSEVFELIQKLLTKSVNKVVKNQKHTSTPSPTIPEVENELKIDLTELKKIASEAVKKTDRTVVKDIISKYGGKIAEVKPEDYEVLAKELRSL